MDVSLHSAQHLAGLEQFIVVGTLAGYLGVPVSTVNDWRVNRKGPAVYRFGNHVMFAISDVTASIEQQRDPAPPDGVPRASSAPGTASSSEAAPRGRGVDRTSWERTMDKECRMTVSMRVMSAGNGYRYLLKTVAAADGNRDLTTPLTRYYHEKGTPPGYWLGCGIPGLGAGQLAPGAEVTEMQLRLLLGLGRDPVTGDPLGKAWPAYRSAAERIEVRIDTLPDGLGVGEAVTRIEAEEKSRGRRRPVAGSDYTFSVPKSVSTLWAGRDGS